MMLGATRPSVTLVAGTLQKAGLITYRRGTVTVKDRERLKAASSLSNSGVAWMLPARARASVDRLVMRATSE